MISKSSAAGPVTGIVQTTQTSIGKNITQQYDPEFSPGQTNRRVRSDIEHAIYRGSDRRIQKNYQRTTEWFYIRIVRSIILKHDYAVSAQTTCFCLTIA